VTIIPAIDLMGGKCVRLTRGKFDTSVTYSDDPVEMAATFASAGYNWLHLVDLDGARTGSSKHLEILQSIKAQTNLKVDFGGGLRDKEAVGHAFEHGADMVTVGSAAIRQPAHFVSWLDEFGTDRIILAADVKDGFVAVSGWKETSTRPLEDTIEGFVDAGLTHVMITDISKDGTLAGPAVDLYRDIKASFPDLFLIASGGVSSSEDLEHLRAIGCNAAIVGKAFYEGRIPIESAC
jgi:phosphoribosylformimino-5-aminoimidazole carboxamide ribotide isomerase